MDQSQDDAFPLFKLPAGLLDAVVGSLELCALPRVHVSWAVGRYSTGTDAPAGDEGRASPGR